MMEGIVPNPLNHIHITPLDAVYVKVMTQAGSSIPDELYERFTFEVSGAKYHPKVKQRLWDGKIHLFDKRSNRIYHGLLDSVISFCVDNGHTYSLDESILEHGINSPKDITDFIDALKLSSNGNPLTMRKYQRDAVIDALMGVRGVFVSPTASGKSAVIYSIVMFLTKILDLRGLVIVPSTSLVEQMRGDFIDYAGMNDGLDLDADTHVIYSGKDKNIEKPITISTWQSLYRLNEEWFDRFDFVIGDECHKFKANQLRGIMERCRNAKYRFGFTGTLDGSPTNKLVLEGLFGKVNTVTSYSEMMKNSQIPDVAIKCIILKHESYPKFRKEHLAERRKKHLGSESGQEKYFSEIEFIVTDEKRNRFIKTVAVSHKHNILLLVNRVDHAKALFEMVKSDPKMAGRNAYLMIGETKTSKREEMRASVENDDNAVIIGTYGVLSTGVNIRNLHYVVFASPSGKSRITALQSLGRALRLHKSKNKVILYDITDDLRTTKSSKSYVLNHVKERIQTYAQEHLDYEIVNIDI